MVGRGVYLDTGELVELVELEIFLCLCGFGDWREENKYVGGDGYVEDYVPV